MNWKEVVLGAVAFVVLFGWAAAWIYWRSAAKPTALRALGLIGGVGIAGAVFGALVCSQQWPGKAGVSSCAGEGARERWLATPNPRYDNETPRVQGYRGAGSCTEIIESRNLDCSRPDTLQGDSPQLADALGLGFTTYRCVDARGARDYPLASIVSR